jgi:hypothetical protein
VQSILRRSAFSVGTEKDHNSVREEARQLMLQIQEKSVEYEPDRKVRRRRSALCLH